MFFNNVIKLLMLILCVVVIRRLLHAVSMQSNGLAGFDTGEYMSAQDFIKSESKKIKTHYKWKFSTDQPDFQSEVRAILARSGWVNTKDPSAVAYKLEEVPADAAAFDISIGLLSREEMERTAGSGKKEYYPDGTRIYFSRTWLREPRVIEIDETNWREGVAQSNLSIADYKDYVINHEMGHALGYDHDKCTAGRVCPIMYQMTRGLPAGASPSHNVTAADIARQRLLL
jgi:hypothetical protein